MNNQDFNIESSFREVENVVIDKPFIIDKPSTFKAPTDLSREEQLLSIVVHLDNGTTGYLITSNKTAGACEWSCHVCFPFKVSSLSLLEEHLTNKMHLLEMEKSPFPAKNFSRACSETRISIGMPSMVPPGIEGVVDNTLAHIQATLDSIFIPLIGIEYVVELLPPELTEKPMYLCVLCDKRRDPHSFPYHLSSINHQLAYLQRHFRILASALKKLKNKSSEEFKKIVLHVIGKIEETYGRMKPTVINATLFDSSPHEILRLINNGKHIMESPEDLWMLDMIKFAENPLLLQKKFPLKKITEKNKRDEEEKQMSFKKNQRINVNKSQLRLKDDKEESDSDVEFIDIKPNTESRRRKHMSNREDSKYRRHRSSHRSYYYSTSQNHRKSPTRSKTTSKITSRFRSHSFRRPRSRSFSRPRSRSRSPYYYRNMYSSHRSREPISTLPNVHPMPMSGYVSGHPDPRMFDAGPYMSYPRPFMGFPPPMLYSPNIYSVEKERNTSERTRLIQEYEKAVEEMKMKMEMKLEQYIKNPVNHPLYQDEWKKFCSQRYKELQINGKNSNLYDFKPEWKVLWNKRIHEMHSKNIIENIKKLKDKILGDFDINKSSSELLSTDSPSLNDNKKIIDLKHCQHNILVSEVLNRDSDILVNKLYSDTKLGFNWESPITSDSEDSINDHNRPKQKIKIANPLNVITVLRQLSVLESQLGVLAPTIVDLLSTSLKMEKVEPKSSIRLLTPENCAILETVKEKLKSQLFECVVKSNLMNTTMFSIRNIDRLLQFAPKFIPTLSMSNATSFPMSVKLPEVGVVSKMAMVQQNITKSSLAENKVDSSQNDLEILINSVINGSVIKTTSEEVDKEAVELKNINELSHGDIINLLNHFRDLNTCEQDGLIAYLKKLGKEKPDEVKQFRKYINMGPSNLKEVNSMFVYDDNDNDDDGYELLEVCKAIKEKLGEQKDEDMNQMTINFEITEEQKQLLSSIKHCLPEIKSDYSLEPTNTQIQTIPDQSFFKSQTELLTTSYSLDRYSAKKDDSNYSLTPVIASTFSSDQLDKNNFSQDLPNKYKRPQEQPNKYSKPQGYHNKYNVSQEPVNKYNVTEDLPSEYNISQKPTNKYNTFGEQYNEYKKPQEQPNKYSKLQGCHNKYNVSQEPVNKYNISQEKTNKYSIPHLPNKYNTSGEQYNEYNKPEEHPNKYSKPQGCHNKYNVSQDPVNKYNISQDLASKYNTSGEQYNEYNKPEEHPNKYSKPQGCHNKYNVSQDPVNKYNISQDLASKYNTSREQYNEYNKPEEHPNKYSKPQGCHNKYNVSQDPVNKYNISQDLASKYNTSGEQYNEYNKPDEHPNKYNVSQDPVNKYNISQDLAGKYNTSGEQFNENNIFLPKPDSYSAYQVDNYNEPYSQNQSNYYYHRPHKNFYNKYDQNASSYYKDKNTYNSSNTYCDTYQGTPKENNSNNQFNRNSWP